MASPAPDFGIVFCVDHNFIRPLAVSILSAIDNTPTPEDLHFLVLARGFSAEDEARLRSLTGQTGARIDIADIGDRDFAGLREWQHITNVMHARMMLQDFVPPHWKRAVYLDADVLVRGDITDLNRIDLDGKVLGAVEDDIVHVYFEANWPGQPNPLEGQIIFNTGVLVIDLERWVTEEIGSQALALARDPVRCMTGTDQEALNTVVNGRWKQIDPAWNVMTHFYYRPRSRRKYESALQDVKLRHFTSEYKPWLANSHTPGADLYLPVLRRVPWAPQPTGKA
jgi:lipopolysaccharide biosynthesis glycosyltransferase